MKKYLALLCASMMCVCCLALAACGGGAASSNAAASGSAATSSTAASSAAVDPAKAVVGEWQIAAIETQGVSMSGDINSVIGEEGGVILNMKDDGTAELSYGEDISTANWTISGSDLTLESDDDETLTGKFENDSIVLTAPEDAEFQGSMVFTKDGTYAEAAVIDPSGAKDITSADAAVGEWKLSAMSLMGVSMHGDPDALAAIAGDTDTTLTINADGTASLMGSSVPYTVDDAGLVLGNESLSIPVKMLGDDLMIDMSQAMGSDIIMVFSK